MLDVLAFTVLPALRAVAVSLLAWIPIGGLTEYPRLVHALSLHELPTAFQLVRLLPVAPSTQRLRASAAQATLKA